MIDKVGYYSLQSISTSFVLSNFEVIITLCSSTVVICNKPHPTLYDALTIFYSEDASNMPSIRWYIWKGD